MKYQSMVRTKIAQAIAAVFLCSIAMSAAPLVKQAIIPLYVKYRGMIKTGGSNNESKIEVRVIDSPALYQEFIGTIPKEKISKKKPPQSNDDPLLKHPEIDFTRYMMVAIIRYYLWSPPNILSVTKRRDTLVIRYSLPKANIKEQADGYGSYCAVVVPRMEFKKVSETRIRR